MSTTTDKPLPTRRPELIIRPFSKPGEYVVKNPRKGSYLRIGEQEQFLLLQLDGSRSEADVLQAFHDRFDDPLSKEDLKDFLDMASQRDLLNDGRVPVAVSSEDEEDDEDIPVEAGNSRKQSWLYFRYRLLDPDRVLNWMMPRLAFVWTAAFVWTSLAAIGLSGIVSWTHRQELVTAFGKSLNVETAVLVWLITIAVTAAHEFAHGLTCKRFGGEVREMGILVMFFTPCFYCNVSDAWLIPEKSKRLWITAAGGYCDLILWAMAVAVWRITHQDTLINYTAYVVLSVCGFRGLINLNPLMRLDGYYLLSDWLEIPNLRRRSQERWMSFVRWGLWGAKKPQPEPQGRLLTVYGAFRWLFYVTALDLMYVGLCRWLGERWGIVGFALATYLAFVIVRRLFRGFTQGELLKMLKTRFIRTAVWAVALVVAVVGLFAFKMEERSIGTFTVRPAKHVEVRAPVAGFLRAMNYDMGERIGENAVIGRLEIPDLESLIAQKSAQQRESEANLRRLQAGPRAEELREQQLKVDRAKNWYDLGLKDLERAKQATTEELARLDQQISASRAEADYAFASLKQAEQLYQRGVMAGQQFMSERKRYDISLLTLQQVQAQRRAREAGGTLEAEAEAARRQKELADIEATLKLLQAGSRPEEIEAEQARLARIKEELTHLLDTKSKLDIHSPWAGLMTTARMKEKIGQYFEKGALICVIEDSAGLEAEIAMAEQEVAGVEAGQTVELKARALPFRTFSARVDRISPRAEVEQGALQGKVIVYCRLDKSDADLLAGMTGMGRVFRGRMPLATIGANKAMKYLRTEFWW